MRRRCRTISPSGRWTLRLSAEITSSTFLHDVGGLDDEGDRVAREDGTEERPHPMPAVRSARISQTEEILRRLRLRTLEETSELLLGEEALTMVADQATSERSDHRPREKCGIIGCSGTTPVTSDLYYGLRILQHRGQESAGLAVYNGEMKSKRGMGLMIDGTVYAGRYPLAVRPLCVGEGNGRFMIASESVVFDALGFKFIRDLKPGEIVELRPDGFDSMRLPHPNHTAHCMFEWVYFARPDSILDERLVYDARVKIGEQLAKEYPVEADIIVPVPESGRAQAQGYAQLAGLPVVEGLIKNRYIERTFIMPDQQEREIGVMLKLNPIRSAVKNKRIVLIDDSIVRGTTIRKIVQILRQAGAKEVHVRIGCLPIRFPCYLGIDMKTRDQFIANEKTVPEIADFINADSLGYLSMKGLIAALRHSREDICLGCLTGEYPVPIPGEKMRKEKPLELFSESTSRKPSAKRGAKAAT